MAAKLIMDRSEPTFVIASFVLPFSYLSKSFKEKSKGFMVPQSLLYFSLVVIVLVVSIIVFMAITAKAEGTDPVAGLLGALGII